MDAAAWVIVGLAAGASVVLAVLIWRRRARWPPGDSDEWFTTDPGEGPDGE